MTHTHETDSLGTPETAAKLDLLRKLGQYQIVRIGDNTIGIIDPHDLIDGEEPRLLASFDLGVAGNRGLDRFFSVLIGPAMVLAVSKRDFVLDPEVHSQLGSGD